VKKIISQKYGQFKNWFYLYEQPNELAMGSPLSPILDKEL
jgi:hypothetical protein